MTITKQSLWSGKTHTLDLDITPAQLAAWQGGMLIQVAMPHLTAAEREFLISGLTAAEWTEMCQDAEPEEEEA